MAAVGPARVLAASAGSTRGGHRPGMTPTRAPQPTAAAKARSPRAARLAAAIVGAIAGLAAGAVTGAGYLPVMTSSLAGTAARMQAAAVDILYLDTTTTPNLPVPGPAHGTGAYAFVSTTGGSPAAWDACTPIDVVVNLDRAPDNVMVEVDGTFERISSASPFRFDVIGTTSVIPDNDWPVVAERGERGWPPLVIAFADDADTDLLSGTQAATGGGWRIGTTYVSGSVVIDTAHTGDYRRGFGPGSLGGLLLHETLHVLGLDHVEDRSQVMFPLISAGPGELGRGDVTGLAGLVRGRCP